MDLSINVQYNFLYYTTVIRIIYLGSELWFFYIKQTAQALTSSVLPSVAIFNSELSEGWKIWSSVPGRFNRFLFFIMFWLALKHSQPPSPQVLWILSLGVKLTTHLYLALRLRMSGAMHPFLHMSLCNPQWQLYLCPQYDKQFYCT